MNQYELEKLWLSSQPPPGVSFRYYDSVRITDGEYAGESGRLIGLIAVEPTPVYVVEIGPNGEGVTVAQPDIEAAL